MLFPPQGLVAAALQPYALISLLLTPNVTAASQTINAAPTASTITAANALSFTGTIGQIALPAITPAANGAGITLTSFNFTQGAIANVADSEAITVKHIIITGAAGAALETGVYTWSGIEITIPNQAANAAANVASGIIITGGTQAGGATAAQRGITITMAAATHEAVRVALGSVMIGGAASPPAPDTPLHVWTGTAGAVAAFAGTGITVESADNTRIVLLSPADKLCVINFGSPTSNIRGSIWYDHGASFADTFNFGIAGNNRLVYGAGSFAFQENTTIARASVAGVAATMLFDIPVGAGGAANNVLQWSFRLDSVTEAGLLGETDGAGTYTQGKTIWKIPYRDSGANVAAPTAPTTAATWLGGVRVEAGDDTNRIYFYANEAWHYINQTAGFEVPAHETVCPHCGKDMDIGDDVIGTVDRRIGDGALHGVWRHARCKRR